MKVTRIDKSKSIITYEAFEITSPTETFEAMLERTGIRWNFDFGGYRHKRGNYIIIQVVTFKASGKVHYNYWKTITPKQFNNCFIKEN